MRRHANSTGDCKAETNEEARQTDSTGDGKAVANEEVRQTDSTGDGKAEANEKARQTVPLMAKQRPRRGGQPNRESDSV